MRRSIVLGIALFGWGALGWPASGQAELRTSGGGKDRVIDAAQFTGKRADQYKLFVSRCTGCHDQSRTVASLESGVGSVTGAKFDRDGMKAYVVNLMRKPNSGLTKEEAPEILEFLGYARELAQTAKVVPFGPGMDKPKKKSGPDPAYTREAREAKVEGKMLVQCVVSTDGTLRECKVLKSLPFMEQAVLSALSQQRWEPATMNGKPLPVLYTIPLTFKLKG